jgi:hypothetical protein
MLIFHLFIAVFVLFLAVLLLRCMSCARRLFFSVDRRREPERDGIAMRSQDRNDQRSQKE